MNTETLLEEINKKIKILFPEISKLLVFDLLRGVLVSTDKKEQSISFDTNDFFLYQRFLENPTFETENFGSCNTTMLVNAKIRMVLIGKNKNIRQLFDKLGFIFYSINNQFPTIRKMELVKGWLIHDDFIKDEFLRADQNEYNKVNELFKDSNTGIAAIDYETTFYFECIENNCI